MVKPAVNQRHLVCTTKFASHQVFFRPKPQTPVKRLYFVLAATIFLGTAIPAGRAAVQVSLDFFHENLESYGDWREVGDYGYCWQPRDVDRDWRPYSDGRWVYTDAGWTWDSDEPYSWAVYHYGRWARVDRIGWVWVPGTEWGPAWVSWRRSPRHIGWAPLPPEARFTRSVGFGGLVDIDYDIGPTNYSFVEVRNFGAPRLRTVIVQPRENITIIHQTRNITRITYVNNVVYNEGPQYDLISRETAQPIRRLKLQRREDLDFDPRKVRGDQLRARVDGDSLQVVAPTFDTKPATAPRKFEAKVEKAEVDRGWKDAGPPDEVEKLRTKIKSEPATSAELPPQPKTEKTAEAPAVSSVPSPEPKKKKPAKGKAIDDGQPARPAAPVTSEAVPAPPGRPIAPDKPAKSGKPAKGAKAVKPEASSQRPPPPATEEPAPSSESKKNRIKASEPLRRPAEALPPEKVPGRKPTRNLPPAAVEPERQEIHPGKGDARPKSEQQSAVRRIERNIPDNPEPRPQAKRPEPRRQAAPAVTQPQPPQPATEKGKGKGKGKGEKKDGLNPEGTPQ
jgi:hypothetical protein